MSLSYTWEFVSANEGLLVGIIHTVTWRCTATDDDGNTATIDGSTVFDDVAVLQNQPEPLTGTRSAFLENPTGAQCLQWVIDAHNAADFRLSALEAMLKKELYGDSDDEAYPQPARTAQGYQVDPWANISD